MVHAVVEEIDPQNRDMTGCVDIPPTTIPAPITEVNKEVALRSRDLIEVSIILDADSLTICLLVLVSAAVSRGQSLCM